MKYKMQNNWQIKKKYAQGRKKKKLRKCDVKIKIHKKNIKRKKNIFGNENYEINKKNEYNLPVSGQG